MSVCRSHPDKLLSEPFYADDVYGRDYADPDTNVHIYLDTNVRILIPIGRRWIAAKSIFKNCFWIDVLAYRTLTIVLSTGVRSRFKTFYCFKFYFLESSTYSIQYKILIQIIHKIKLIKVKAPRKHSLHEKTAVSVLLKLFIRHGKYSRISTKSIKLIFKVFKDVR